MDAQIDKQMNCAQARLSELKERELSLRKLTEQLECPRDDSLDNSFIIWYSQSFGGLSGGSDSTGTGVSGDSSVSSISNRLEDTGLMIRRCSDHNEVLSRVRDLQSDRRLRCLVSFRLLFYKLYFYESVSADNRR